MWAEELKRQISKADSAQIDGLMDAVFARKRELYPQWDIQYVALPKDDWDEREKILKYALAMEERFRKQFCEKQLLRLCFWCMMISDRKQEEET